MSLNLSIHACIYEKPISNQENVQAQFPYTITILRLVDIQSISLIHPLSHLLLVLWQVDLCGGHEHRPKRNITATNSGTE